MKSNETLCSYEFGNVDKVIYTSSKQLYIFNFTDGKLFRYDQIDNNIVVCSYPDGYIFHNIFPPTVNEISDGNLIIIGGGYDVNSHSDKVKIYNTSIDSWSNGIHLPTILVNHATVVYNKDVYVIGGYADNKNTHLLVYRHGKWVHLTPLCIGRQRHLAILYNECIYVFTDNRCKMKPECYDIQNDRWSTLETDLYDGVYNSNSIYDNNNYIIYTIYKNDDIYCIDMKYQRKKLLYSNCKDIEHLVIW